MKQLLVFLLVSIILSSYAQEIKRLNQLEIDRVMELVDIGNFSKISSLDYFSLAISCDTNGGLIYRADSLTHYYIKNLTWYCHAPQDWISDKEIHILLRYIDSNQKCMKSTHSFCSTFCSGTSILGKEICLFLFCKLYKEPYPENCLALSDQE